jgi:hypothetical protein
MRHMLAATLAGCLLLSGCATHRMVVPLPVTGSESFAPEQTSNATIWGNSVRPLRADRCAGTNAMSEVRARTSLGQALATVLTLGFWQPLSMDYVCAKAPTDAEPIDP